MTLLQRIPVVVDFSRESPRRPGRLTITERGDTIVFKQTLERTEQWEYSREEVVFIPRGLLEALFAQPLPEAIGVDPITKEWTEFHAGHTHRELGGGWGKECLITTPPVWEETCPSSPTNRHKWEGRYCAHCGQCENEL